VNLKLFTPAPNKRRTVLLFVFRDRTRTPLSRLIETWEEDLRQMWAAITKPPDYDQYSFADFFEVGSCAGRIRSGLCATSQDARCAAAEAPHQGC
jgi:hypothetical protein